MNSGKLDAIDLIVSVLQEHEATLEIIATKIENLLALRRAESEGQTDRR